MMYSPLAKYIIFYKKMLIAGVMIKILINSQNKNINVIITTVLDNSHSNVQPHAVHCRSGNRTIHNLF